jgi:hypothetical protein
LVRRLRDFGAVGLVRVDLVDEMLPVAGGDIGTEARA